MLLIITYYTLTINININITNINNYRNSIKYIIE